MKKQINLMKVITLVLLLLSLSSCAEANANSNPSILIIQGVPRGEMRTYFMCCCTLYGNTVSIFRTGTTFEQARIFAGLEANGSSNTRSNTNPESIITPLFLPSTSINWTGSGTYDIMINNQGRGTVIARNVRFTSGVVYVQWSSFQEATQ